MSQSRQCSAFYQCLISGLPHAPELKVKLVHKLWPGVSLSLSNHARIFVRGYLCYVVLQVCRKLDVEEMKSCWPALSNDPELEFRGVW